MVLTQKYKLQSILLLVLMLPLVFSAQVGVNQSTPDASSAIDISATNQGFLLPRVSLNDVSDISISATIPAPAIGLVVWNINPAVVGGNGIGYYYFDGIVWRNFSNNNALDNAYDEGGAGNGRTILATDGTVRIESNDGILITGALGNGNDIDIEVSGAGTRFFFNPFKAGFAAGAIDGVQWDDINRDNYTFGVGQNTRPKSGRGFAANFATEVNTNSINGASFGNASEARKSGAFATGFTTISTGNQSFSQGDETRADGTRSMALGEFTQARSRAEIALGSFNRNYTTFDDSDTATDSEEVFYSQDRIMSIGNGTSTSARSNVLEIWKDGRIIINDEYTLPIADGAVDQTLTSDGSGNIAWEDENTFDTGFTQICMYTNDAGYTMNNTGANTDLAGFDMALIPDVFEASGNVEIKMVIRYSSLTGTERFRLRIHDGTTQTIPITTNPLNWTNTILNTGGVIESNWSNLAGGTAVFEAHLSGSMENPGESIVVQNAYLLIRSQ